MNPDEELQTYVASHQDSLQEIAKEMVAKRIFFQGHLILWAGVNLLLILIFALTDVSWVTFLWTLIPWGFAVLLHGFNYVVFRNGLFGNYNAYAYGYSIFLYITSNILMLFIDLIDGSPLEILWFWWALMGTSIAFVLHTIIFLIIRAKSK